MNTQVERKWKGLSPTAFDKYVDKLSSEKYRSMCAADPEFLEAVNTAPDMRKTWGKDPNYRINKDSELGRFIQAEEDDRMRPVNEAIKEFQEQAQALAIEMRDKLKRRLDNSAGLTPDLLKFFLNEPEYRNLPVLSKAGSGMSLTPADNKAIAKAYHEFCADANREFAPDEQNKLLLLLDAAAGTGKMLSPMDPRCWKVAFVLAKTVGRVAHTATTKPEEKKVNLERAEPTTTDLRRAYKHDVVFHSRKLNCDLTLEEIARLGSDDYAAIIKEGFKADGKLLMHTDQLRPGRGN